MITALTPCIDEAKLAETETGTAEAGAEAEAVVPTEETTGAAAGVVTADTGALTEVETGGAVAVIKGAGGAVAVNRGATGATEAGTLAAAKPLDCGGEAKVTGLLELDAGAGGRTAAGGGCGTDGNGGACWAC